MCRLLILKCYTCSVTAVAAGSMCQALHSGINCPASQDESLVGALKALKARQQVPSQPLPPAYRSPVGHYLPSLSPPDRGSPPGAAGERTAPEASSSREGAGGTGGGGWGTGGGGRGCWEQRRCSQRPGSCEHGSNGVREGGGWKVEGGRWKEEGGRWRVEGV